MNKKKIISLISSFCIVISVIMFLYLPKSIESVLKRLDYPFEVGEIVSTQQIDKNTSLAIFTNKEKSNELQNAIIRKNGLFYKLIDQNGSLTIEKTKNLESGSFRTQRLISWYDKSDKYVITIISYDEDVESITYQGQKTKRVDFNGYTLFYGYGIGVHEEIKLFDKNGNILENIKP